MNLLLVFAGGGAGAVLRYLLGLLPIGGSFPIITCAINILGSFLIGLIFGLSSRATGLNPQLVLLLQVGFCGGFTTFSTFSLDLFRLLDQGSYGLGLGYAAGTVLACLIFTYLGRQLVLNLN
jgi:CrcB protein